MALRKVSFVPGEYYHIYNRGVEKRNIFLDKSDFIKFEYLMYICNTEKSIVLRDISENFDRGETIVDIGVYCLMKNHFHILIKEKVERGITSFTRKLFTAYSMYFNKKYKRTGKLWQGVFQSSHIDSDNYLKYIYAYIHLNPAKYIDPKWKENSGRDSLKLFNYVSSYQHSSLSFYLNNDSKNKILNPVVFPKYFIDSNEHKEELLDWLSFNP